MIEIQTCSKCNGYGWDMVDGVCSVCLNKRQHEQPENEPAPPTCAYCGKPAKAKYAVWINGRITENVYCDNKCASFAQMGAEG